MDDRDDTPQTAPQTAPEPPEPPEPPEAPEVPSVQALRRDVTTLRATVEQHNAELDTLNVEQLLLVFALGALAAQVFLQHRRIQGLADALGH